MNTSRIVRGTRGRIFIYVCAILIVTGIIACYNNTLSQLKEAKKSNEICHQQEENLSTQLQVISDYKQRLEKSLKTEKAEHQLTKGELENKLKEEKSKSDKTAKEVEMRFSSLQQHSNMLQTQYEDFKEECSKSQKKQLDDINDLQSKLKEIQEELKKVESAKENLRSQLTQLQIDNENQIKQTESLRKEIANLKDLKNLTTSHRSSTENNNNDNNNNGGDVSNNNVGPQPPGYEQVLAAPASQNNISTKSSTTAPSVNKVSVGSLDGAAPIMIPTVTPDKPQQNGDEMKAALPLPFQQQQQQQQQKLPEGVVPVPEIDDNKKSEDEKFKEIPGDSLNARYRNKIVEAKDEQKVEDLENGAHEEMDQPLQNNAFEQFGFDDKQNFDKHHIDNLAVGKENRDFNENGGLIENEADADDPDDADDYDHVERQNNKDAVIRN